MLKSILSRLRHDPKWLKVALNFYPPYIGAGVKVKKFSSDFREVEVEMPLRWFNRNYMGTHFGGSLYSMVDPFYVLMLSNILGKDYIVWDQAAEIYFRRPGKGTVYAKFYITQEQIEDIKRKTEGGQVYRPKFKVEIKDKDGNMIAEVFKVLYIKKKDKSFKT